MAKAPTYTDVYPHFRGEITFRGVEPDGLRIEGWAETADGRPADAFRVTVGTVPISDFILERGEQVQRSARADGTSTESMFCVRIPVSNHRDVEDQLVTLVPLFDGQAGASLLCVPLSTRPVPTTTDLLETDDPAHAQRVAQLLAGSWPVGFQFLGHLVNRTGLQPQEDVLEVGCGLGRVAQAISFYLSPHGSYTGFDVMERPIQWAKANISSRTPNFRFNSVSVHNGSFGRDGDIQASGFAFPYEDAAFDVVFLVSVFTHMLASDVQQYLREIRRVLRRGGRCLSTWYLLDDHSTPLHAAGQTKQAFPHPIEYGATERADIPEHLIAFDKSAVLSWIEAVGLKPAACYPGRWRGLRNGLSYQDILVLTLAEGEA